MISTDLDAEGRINLKEHQFNLMYQITSYNYENNWFDNDVTIPEEIGKFSAHIITSRLDNYGITLQKVPTIDFGSYPNFSDDFGVSQYQQDTLIKYIQPQFIFDFEDAHLQGASWTSPEHSKIQINFNLCNHNKKGNGFKGVDCATDDEIEQFFSNETQYLIYFFHGANYIDFDDI